MVRAGYGEAPEGRLRRVDRSSGAFLLDSEFGQPRPPLRCGAGRTAQIGYARRVAAAPEALRSTNWALEGCCQVFLISLSGFRAPFFRTQDSTSLDHRYAVVCGKLPRSAMLDV